MKLRSRDIPISATWFALRKIMSRLRYRVYEPTLYMGEKTDDPFLRACIGAFTSTSRVGKVNETASFTKKLTTFK